MGCCSLRIFCLILLTLCLLGAVLSLLEDQIHKSLGMIGIILFGLANYAIATETPKLLLPSIVWLIVVPLIILLNLYLNGSYELIESHLTEEQADYFIVYAIAASIVIYVLALLTAFIIWSHYKEIMLEVSKKFAQALAQCQKQTQLNKVTVTNESRAEVM